MTDEQGAGHMSTIEQDTPTPMPTNGSVGAMSDGITYNDDGTVSFVINGKPCKLRRPTFGEFKALYEAINASQGLSGMELMQANIEAALLIFNGAEVDGRPVKGLADAPLTDDPGEWPVWFVGGRWTTNLTTHWLTVPLPHGGA